MRAPISGDHVDVLRRDTLQPPQLVRVEAELQDRRTLHDARELGVGGLIAPRPQPARALDAKEEVGPALPPPIEEGGLGDHVDAGAHRFQRQAVRLPQRLYRPVGLGRELAHLLAGLTLPGQEARLALVAAGLDHVQCGIEPHRPREQTVGRLSLERRQVRAGQMAHEVGRAEDEGAVEDLHGEGREKATSGQGRGRSTLEPRSVTAARSQTRQCYHAARRPWLPPRVGSQPRRISSPCPRTGRSTISSTDRFA